MKAIIEEIIDITIIQYTVARFLHRLISDLKFVSLQVLISLNKRSFNLYSAENIMLTNVENDKTNIKANVMPIIPSKNFIIRNLISTI